MKITSIQTHVYVHPLLYDVCKKICIFFEKLARYILDTAKNIACKIYSSHLIKPLKMMRSDSSPLMDTFRQFIYQPSPQTLQIQEDELLGLINELFPHDKGFKFSGNNFLKNASSLGRGFGKIHVIEGLSIFDQLKRDYKRFPVHFQRPDGVIISLGQHRADLEFEEDITCLKKEISQFLTNHRNNELIVETAINCINQTTLYDAVRTLAHFTDLKKLILCQNKSFFKIQIDSTSSIKLQAFIDFKLKDHKTLSCSQEAPVSITMKLLVTAGKNGADISAVKYIFQK